MHTVIYIVGIAWILVLIAVGTWTIGSMIGKLLIRTVTHIINRFKPEPLIEHGDHPPTIELL